MVMEETGIIKTRKLMYDIPFIHDKYAMSQKRYNEEKMFNKQRTIALEKSLDIDVNYPDLHAKNEPEEESEDSEESDNEQSEENEAEEAEEEEEENEEEKHPESDNKKSEGKKESE